MISISWRSLLYGMAIILFAVAIGFWILAVVSWLMTNDPRYEPMSVLLGGVISALGGTLSLLKARRAPDVPVSEALKYTPTAEQRARNRQEMLKMVDSFWVKGVLKKSLHEGVLIKLGMQVRTDVVERPWKVALQLGQEHRPLPAGTKMVEVFEEMGRTLLILGEPGSGKTTMLLDLARDLISRTEPDSEQPIPVVFNLSSWSGPKQSIEEWLVAELKTQYTIPKKVGQAWVEQDELLLLLDGLDEVASERRKTCVQAINDFCKQHMVAMAICSRTEEYKTLSTRLKLQGAVVIQPITLGQIEDYLTRLTAETGAGDELAPVLRTIKADEDLQAFVDTPLMLNIMVLAAQGISAQKLRDLRGVKIKRQYLFEVYVAEMFKRRRKVQPYTPEQTKKWLGWLAGRMTQHSLTVFWLERMQPGWLETKGQRRLYEIFGWVSFGLIGWVSFGLVFGLSFGLVFGLSFGMLGVLIGAYIGASGAMSMGWLMDIKLAEGLKWSWKKIWPWLILSSSLLIVGLIGRLIIGLIFEVLLVGFVFVGLSFLLLGGLERTEVKTKTTPNQGIWQSVRNAIIVGLISGSIIVGLSGWLIVGVSGGAISELIHIIVLIFGLSSWLIIGLDYGGLAFLQHFTLRFVLWRTGQLPYRLVPFLDYAAERIFLRKVGGGYIFVHRMLLEYFAGLGAGE